MTSDEEIQMSVLDNRFWFSSDDPAVRQTEARDILDRLNIVLATIKDPGLEDVWEFMMNYTGQGWRVLVIFHGDEEFPAGHFWTVRATLNQAIKVPGAKAVLTCNPSSKDAWLVTADGGATFGTEAQARTWIASFNRGLNGGVVEEDQPWPSLDFFTELRLKHKIRHTKS